MIYDCVCENWMVRANDRKRVQRNTKKNPKNATTTTTLCEKGFLIFSVSSHKRDNHDNDNGKRQNDDVVQQCASPLPNDDRIF